MELFTLVWLVVYQTSADTIKSQQVNFRNEVPFNACIEMSRPFDGVVGGVQRFGEYGSIKIVQSTAICVPVSGLR